MSRPFFQRHLGLNDEAVAYATSTLGYDNIDELIDTAVPRSIRLESGLDLPAELNEVEALAALKATLSENVVARSMIGQGYYGCHTPAVIQRNVLENPGWYTAYTPYQAELAQGRLEALLNFQTVVTDLTGLPVANASLLDEGTAAAEAVALALTTQRKGTTVFVAEHCHPQTIEVVRTRAASIGIEVILGDVASFDPAGCEGLFAVLVQYPDTYGIAAADLEDFAARVHEAGALVIAATDLLALTLLRPPGEWGADIAVGTAQRFGVPMGFGGPHAGFIACMDKLKRKLPGRLVGVTLDSQGNVVYRLALQTREQHIRRDKATSNICTAQVLLAVMASMYAIYHGADGLVAIAQRVRGFATRFSAAAGKSDGNSIFDTVVIECDAAQLADKAESAGYNIRLIDDGRVALSFDETSTEDELQELLEIFGLAENSECPALAEPLIRTSDFLTHEVFSSYRSETEMLRYISRLEARDLALNESMIALGSCTMKLNATSEMMPLSWPEVAHIHPFAPAHQTRGYVKMLGELAGWLAEITGFAAVSLQPNAGSQGEYAGLLAIRRYHDAAGDTGRRICLIPESAHGTNPASAVMAGFTVVGISCDEAGNIDFAHLAEMVEKHAGELGALMVTYPSTHGVFEEGIIDICQLIHDSGGLIYMDGANMNAQVGLTSPGKIGADVCHLNLHKTFCIPHGGGGPGVGPIGVVEHLVPYLPGHTHALENTDSPVCSAPYGSASINVISWMYIAMMGGSGLTLATKVAILSANYIAHRLRDHFPVLYTGREGLVAHECIIDLRELSKLSGITVEDVAKRMGDYGYHAPTMAWPVNGTLMIEPTESESLAEMDRFCDSMIAIRKEIQAVIDGEADREDNVLKNAPHTAEMVTADDWSHPYSRQQAAYPREEQKSHKFWPSVGRVDNVHGDRNLACTCGAVADYAK